MQSLQHMEVSFITEKICCINLVLSEMETDKVDPSMVEKYSNYETMTIYKSANQP